MVIWQKTKNQPLRPVRLSQFWISFPFLEKRSCTTKSDFCPILTKIHCGGEIPNRIRRFHLGPSGSQGTVKETVKRQVTWQQKDATCVVRVMPLRGHLCDTINWPNASYLMSLQTIILLSCAFTAIGLVVFIVGVISHRRSLDEGKHNG